MDCDVLIIGAGVVGLAIAAQLSDRYSCFLVERFDSFGNETSSRNSEVIHSGIYYPKNSLKTQLCVEGNPLLYEFCEKYRVPFKKTGKYIVAINNSDNENLEEIFKTGTENGVKNLRHVSKLELSREEPNINADAALFAAETGIIDSHSLMYAYSTIAQNNGCPIAYNHNVEGIEKMNDHYRTSIECGGESFFVSSQIIVNSAGLDSDSIAEKIGINTKEENLSLQYCKGHYFKIVNNSKFGFRHLIYPAPEKIKTGLGIHVTIDLGGNAKLGPDTFYTDSRDKDYSIAEGLRDKFLTAAQRYIKGIKSEDILPDYSGIRPKLQKRTESFRDFYIKHEKERGLEGFINLIGIESPGLTASLAIARYVDKLL